MKVMFSAGEASGDTHAASVATALREIDPSVDMFGMGWSAPVFALYITLKTLASLVLWRL